MWQKIVVKLYCLLGYFAMKFIYGPISSLWRSLFERKYETVPKNLPWLEPQVLTFFSQCTWTQDPLNGLLDVISKPARIYETKKGDCDEYAAFACYVLPWKSYIASITWFCPLKKGLSKFQGHNVCLFRRKEKWWHIGNWGLRGPFETPMDAINSVPPSTAIPCCYSLRDPETLRWEEGGYLKR